MYWVVTWVDNKVVASYEEDELSRAKRHARRLGHDGTHNGRYYSANALVENIHHEAVYVPRYLVGRHDDLYVDPATIL